MAILEKFTWLRFISFLSGASLAFFGVLSVLIGVGFSSVAGISIGVVLSIHGGIELIKRSQLFRAKSRSALRWLVWNQLILALSVSAYFIWQLSAIDPDVIMAILFNPEYEPIWELFPSDAKHALEASLPSSIKITYVTLLVVVCMGCMLTALFYRKRGEAYITFAPELE